MSKKIYFLLYIINLKIFNPDFVYNLIDAKQNWDAIKWDTEKERD